MTNIKKIVSVLFSAILLFSATATNSIAMDKIHFVIGGGAGGGWDGTARGTGEALTKSGMLKSASFENMSGGGGGKALAFMINTKPKNTILVQSTPLVLRSITRHEGYVTDAPHHTQHTFTRGHMAEAPLQTRNRYAVSSLLLAHGATGQPLKSPH